MVHSERRIFSLMLLLLTAVFSAVAAQTWPQEDYSEIRRKVEKRYLPSHSQLPVYRFNESHTINRSDHINAHLVLINGDLRIEGAINASVIAIAGDIIIAPGGSVAGDVTSVGGTIYLRDGARVSGNMLETERDFERRHRNGESYRFSYRYNHSWRQRDMDRWHRSLEPDENNFLLRYNRVEGGVVGFQLPREYHHRVYLTPYGFASYGLESGKFRYQLGFDRVILRSGGAQTVIGGEFHDLTDTKDSWRVGYSENSLAAFVWKQDYYDYFRRKGYRFYASQFVLPSMRFSLEYRNDTYESLALNTGWSLFRGDEDFRLNPSLGDDSGNMRSVVASLRLDTRNDSKFPTRGLLAEVSSELAEPGLGGDFNFRRYLLTLEWHQPLTFGENLMIRAAAGTSSGDLPFQKTYELGGIGSLRGFRFKEFSGTRMFLATAEYRLMPGLLDDWFGIDAWQFILFSDIGDAWSGPEDETIVQGFRPLRLDQLKSSIGIGIGDENGTFRLDIAKRTDRDASAIAMLRIRQPF